MKLNHLYSLRRDFTVVGLTGRTGSGCTTIAEILSGSFSELARAGLRDEASFTDEVFLRKYMICRKFLDFGDNWCRFDIIRYVDVLILYMLKKYGGNYEKTKELFTKYFRIGKGKENTLQVNNIMTDIGKIHVDYIKLITAIKSFSDFPRISDRAELKKLNDIFFSDRYKQLVKEILHAMEKEGYYSSRLMLHWVSCNIRSSGDPLDTSTSSVEYIFSIAELINSLIKARRQDQLGNPTKIVIDSLRNSLEIMFFKQRFAAFYMVAMKDVLGNAAARVNKRLAEKIRDNDERGRVVQALLDLDATEYRTKDFSKGQFSSPDVENCIQKSDYHILNIKIDEISQIPQKNTNSFFTLEEQVMKLMALIQHPGLVTPSSAERAMQIANTAKLNSGCISRKVGAVITDSNYYVKSVGWNDVAKGHTPCNLRSVTDFLDGSDIDNNQHYSDFEKGKLSSSCSFKYKEEKPGNFKEALVDYYNQPYDINKDDLNGKNCSFCFKSIHNHYEGEVNQVHTRSLHAEENAMLQITKLGGMGSEGGFLFTTASPCELCSKKAYQLGIKKIYYIDPYPGIAIDQILHGGRTSDQPSLIPFSGAIGNAYDWLYEPFMSYKDELTMTLELKPKKNISKEFSNLVNSINNSELKELLQRAKLNDERVKAVILEGLKKINTTGESPSTESS